MDRDEYRKLGEAISIDGQVFADVTGGKPNGNTYLDIGSDDATVTIEQQFDKSIAMYIDCSDGTKLEIAMDEEKWKHLCDSASEQ